MKIGQGTRAEAERALREFTPHMGSRYANGRNFDRGPGRHCDVSLLSPYIRRRLITEPEVLKAALAEHGPDRAEKFIQEVIWRSYFKGWLELHPKVWSDYVSGLESDLDGLSMDRALREKVEAAESAATGLDFFNAWATELVETGYLHNHARMWFASIWIFTLGLPWRIGADFFYRHLLDGDPASNTCSWRWVAGLHTRGKTYQAKASNIATFTENRFTPRDDELAAEQSVMSVLHSQEPEDVADVAALRSVSAPRTGVPTLLLLIEEDCTLEDFDIASLDICAGAMLSASHLRSSRDVSERVMRFESTALHDAAARANIDAEPLRAASPRDLVSWAEGAGARQIAMPYVPTGPLADWIDAARPLLHEHGIALTEWQRAWDALVWPHATAGFFKVKKRIPEILDQSGLT